MDLTQSEASRSDTATSSEASSGSGSLSPAVAETLMRLALAVRGTFTTMREEQSPHHGSVCSKRLQDRIQRDFPEEYDAIVNVMYGRSWKKYLAARAGILCFEVAHNAAQPNTEWLLATGVLRCYLRTENIERVKEADSMLGCLVRDKCRGDLERSCRTILMEEFAALHFSHCAVEEDSDETSDEAAYETSDEAAYETSEETAEEAAEETSEDKFPVEDYSLGSLALWQPVLRRLWMHPVEGRRVRLRELRRCCQQLGFHVRVRCRWTELLGNNLLQRYIRTCVLRVLLNVVAPPLEPSTGGNLDAMDGALVLSFDASLGEYTLRLEGTQLWGRIPPVPGHFLRQE
ncbi:uncharacterized protein Tco025E_05502 [Trypanosoma conorhini]|uniref:Uncharacterized protein n=1 Tax=Trypanosoma conorhini TaxID=83891 RepID=A0A422PCT5_9TRYP|nr:uncharacterized protein Tco025E_05502 [Trypanosoma conorhini]RNF15531.1 hypothetical protein Tco025E_05502 [Trypanosoma conorhini]